MSAARLRPSRRFIAGGRVKTYDFSPGQYERLTLRVWRIPRSEGLVHSALTGHAYVACGMGNEHYPVVDSQLVAHPRNNSHPGSLAIAALEGDTDAALELAEILVEQSLEYWFDPCTEDEEES